MRVTPVGVETIWQDVKYGLRQLWCSPRFTAVAVLTLALGIGVNTSIFTLLDALLLRPLSVPNSSGVIGVYRGDERPCSYPDFLDFQQRATAFSGLAADVTNESVLDVNDTSEFVLAEAVSDNYAAVLEVRPVLGRWFTTEAEADRFPAVISFRTWQSRFGGDPHVIGKRVRVESQPYTVVGVAPQGFQGMALPVMTDVWVPLSSYATHNRFASGVLKNRLEGKVLMFGRLARGVTVSQAAAQMNALDAQLRREYPRPEGRAMTLELEGVRGTADPSYRRMVSRLIVLLSAVVGLVLLIACANVANLLLARSLTRRREISIRLALGASRARICRQMLIESLLLSLMGAAAGLAAAQLANRILERGLASAPSPIAVGASLSLDVRVLGFVLIAAVVTTVLFGLIPALQASKLGLVPALKGTEVFPRNRRLTLRNFSVVAQVTFSLVLLIMAGLFVRALQTASGIDPGFDPRKLVSARLFVAESDANETAGRLLYGQVLDSVRRLPGVQSATLSYAAPMLTMSECVAPENATGLRQSMLAGANVVGPDYFSTFGIPIIRGRDFRPSDTPSTVPVVIVNDSLARRYWPGRDPVGKRIRFGRGCEQGQGTFAEIAGVVKDAQYATLQQSARPFVFFPMTQRFERYVALIVRSEGEAPRWAEVLRKQLRAVDGRLRIYEISGLADQMDKALWQTRWEASLLGVFGLLALAIAAVGLYGVIAFATRQRTREFGMRMALGAQKRDVLGLVTGQALAITAVGVALGLLLSVAARSLLRGFLFGLSPTDPLTYAAAGVLWIVVALLASCVPAYRATTVDPLVALRDE